MDRQSDIKTQIYDLVRQGLSCKDVAKIVGIGETTFYRWVDEDQAFSNQIKYIRIYEAIKLPKYKLKLPNPDGKGGFEVNPQNINRLGRPHRISFESLLKTIANENSSIDSSILQIMVAKKLYELAIRGNLQAIKLIFDTMEGKPRQLKS